ncbi:MAG: hypothetical protein R2781_00835 [Flavobacteriaceae bacterium]
MNQYNRQIVNNSIFSIIQILVVTLSAFFLYKYIIDVSGIEKLGLWSLILSVTSLANIGNLGFTGSLVKFTAELSVQKKFKEINALLNSSIVGVGVLTAILLCIIYVIGKHYMGYLIDEKWVQLAIEMLMYALISLYVSIIASMYFSVLEGVNLAYLKSLSFIFATLIYVIFSVIFINKYDIIGMAYAQLIQAGSFLIFGVLFSFSKLERFQLFYFKWHKEKIKEVFNYGVKFQAIGVAQMLYDPITKAILTKYGGLDFVAIFEMCTKLVKQVRSLASGVLQNIVPKITTLSVTQPKEKINEAYLQINRINLILLFFSMVVIIPFSKVFSILLLGYVNNHFIIVLTCLVIGWGINSLNIPSYMVNLGTGNLRWNVISHFVIGVLNVLLCFMVGYFFRNGIYIIISWIVALIIGSSFIIIEYHIRNKLNLTIIFDKVFFQLCSFFILLTAINFFLIRNIENIWISASITLGLILIYYGAILFLIGSIRAQIKAIIKTRF